MDCLTLQFTNLVWYSEVYVYVLYILSKPFFLVTEVNLKNPVVDVTPVPLAGFSSSRDIVSCERVLVAGLSRLKLWSYSSAYRVTLIPSAAIPERLHGKIHICSHK